jgi:hypothetical protein
MEALGDRLGQKLSMATRRRLNAWRVELRRPTASLRGLPDFMVIGVQRGGTSSLFKYLSYHPQIVGSIRKEIEWFNRYRGEKGFDWYRAHFPLKIRKGLVSSGGPLLTFEATPVYLDHPHAPAAIRDLMPDAKLIVLLREPAARALSHHQHMTRHRLEDLPFQHAIRFEEERIRAELEKVRADPCYYSRTYTRYCYAYRGFYDLHLSRWLESFSPDRFLVLKSEDFYRDPSSSLGRIFEFLGVDPLWRPAGFANFSYRDRPPPGYEGMDSATATYLQEKFASHNQRLVDLLGPEFRW